MPFDGTKAPEVVARQLLIDALRRPMPEFFHWDYSSIEEIHPCGTAGCAMSLARAIGLVSHSERCCTAVIGPLLGLSDENAEDIFLGTHPAYDGIDMSAITPEMVADALENAPLENT